MILMGVAVVMLAAAGCQDNASNAVQEAELRPLSSYEVSAEEIVGDFTLKVVSEKAVYQPGEHVNVQAMLMYSGSNEKQKIYHAASPFYFIVTESDKKISVPYVMAQPLVTTEMKQGQWFIEDYHKMGGIFGDEQTVQFLQQFFIAVYGVEKHPAFAR